MRHFNADGLDWKVEVRSPGASNAMVVFHHPSGSRFNRYGWLLWHGPESRSVTSRLNKDAVLEGLEDRDIARLYRRSMPVHAGGQPGTVVSAARG